MQKPYKSTIIRLREQEIQSVMKIREYFGIHSDNQAIITAISLVARQIEMGVTIPSSLQGSDYVVLSEHAEV